MDYSSAAKKKANSSRFLLMDSGEDLFLKLSHLLKEFGINIEPYSEKGREEFFSLDATLVHQALLTAQETVSNIEATIEKTKEGEVINLNQLWLYLIENKLKYPVDLFNFINKEDIIEIYNLENKQVFRSFEFFRYCSYSFDQLFSTPWHELYSRKQEYIEEYMKLLTDLKTNASKEVIQINTIPPHWVSQVKSYRKVKHFLRSKISCLVFDRNDNVAGYLHTQTVLNNELANYD